MIKLLFTLLITISTFQTEAQTKSEKKVADVVEELRKAMINADSISLQKLTSAKLSYGHSGGHIEDQIEFVQKIVSGKSDFVKMNFTEQTIAINNNVALVRHKLNATTNDGGKPGEVHLVVLLVWQKCKGQWKLLARQAIKMQ